MIKTTISCVLLLVLFNTEFIESAIDKDKDCGCYAYATKRIINGFKTNEAYYSWIVKIKSTHNPQLRNLTVCHGILLNHQWLVTAASCTPDDSKLLPEMKVEIRSTKALIDVAQVIRYPDYKRISMFEADYDVALVQLKEPIEFDKNLSPGCLQNIRFNIVDTYSIAGYGSLTPVRVNNETGAVSNFRPSDVLREGQISDQTLDLPACRYKTERSVCTDTKTGSDIACLGDTGTGIHYVQNGKHVVVALAGLPIPQKHGKYIELCNNGMISSRMLYYYRWIKEQLNDDLCHPITPV